jgi:predicted acetyltransferase
MEIRPLRDSELDQAAALDSDAFHGSEDENREAFQRFVDPARIQAALDGDRIVALCGVIGLSQFFGGRSLPMGGLSSVMVAPDWRGTGLSRRLMQASFEDMQARGEPVSSLYPATTSLYRSMGYEIAGNITIRKTTADPLRALPAPAGGRVRPFRDGDEAALRACYARFAKPVNGCLDRKSDWWERKLFGWRDASRYVFEAADGELQGYLVYVQIDGEHSALGGDFGLVVRELVATDRDATLALWRLLGSWGTQVEQIVYRAPAEDPTLLLLPEQRFQTLGEIRWMLRVLDPVRAVGGRGFPHGLGLEVPLQLRDATLPDNSGPVRLCVQKGRGTLDRATEPEGPELEIQGFSSLFSGWATTAALDRAGLLRGGSPDERAALDAAFAGPSPWMLDEF